MNCTISFETIRIQMFVIAPHLLEVVAKVANFWKVGPPTSCITYIAQWVGQRARKPWVAGSNPSIGLFFYILQQKLYQNTFFKTSKSNPSYEILSHSGGAHCGHSCLVLIINLIRQGFLLYLAPFADLEQEGRKYPCVIINGRKFSFKGFWGLSII